MIRFEVVSRFINDPFEIELPKRQTKKAAAYDFEAAETISIPPLSSKRNTEPTLIPTGIKAKMPAHICLIIANRSGGPKRGLSLSNGIGIIDADYYNNEKNEGEIFFAYYNLSDTVIIIKKGDRIGQGFFQHIIYCDGDKAEDKVRAGGFNSTGV